MPFLDDIGLQHYHETVHRDELILFEQPENADRFDINNLIRSWFQKNPPYEKSTKITVPIGSWNFSSGVFPQNCTLQGQGKGSILRLSNFNELVSDTVIRDLSIVLTDNNYLWGDGPSNILFENVYFSATAALDDGVAVSFADTGTENIVFRNCTFNGYGIDCTAPMGRILFEDCCFMDARYGIKAIDEHGTNCEDGIIEVRNCTFSRCLSAIDVDGTNLIISNCIFTNDPATQDTFQIRIRNNQSVSRKVEISNSTLDLVIGCGIDIDGVENVIVKNNMFQRVNTDEGYFLIANSSSQICNITGNVFARGGGYYIEVAPDQVGEKYLVFKDNLFYGAITNDNVVYLGKAYPTSTNSTSPNPRVPLENYGDFVLEVNS